MNRDVLETALEWERTGVTVAMATVVEAIGSVPGKLGARLLVAGDGRVAGTVGGAGLEERAKALCRAVLDGSAQGGLHRFELARHKPGGLDSICGGSVALFVELMTPRPHLVLFGGGHVGQALATVCDAVGYRYTVCDDRPEFATSALFPRAAECVVGNAQAFFAGRDAHAYSHLFVLGYSHHQDEDTLAEALVHFRGKIGLIGSQAKRNDLATRLAARGVDRRQFERRVQCPIGLEIGAETPAEIAVAVIATVISDFRSGSGSSSRAGSRTSTGDD